MHARRRAAAITSLAAMLMLVGCVVQPPAQQQEQVSPSPDATGAPATSEAPTQAPEEPLFEYTTDQSATSVWSFEPVGAEIVETDYDGTPADPGHRLVVLYIDGQLLSESGDFYWDFRVGSVNPETDQFIGLSSGTDFYANNDLFTAGQSPNFRDAAAIYQVPDDWPLGLWRFTCHETGEVWEIEVPVDGA